MKSAIKLKMETNKMKKLFVSFLVIASLLLLATNVSAYTVSGNLADIYEVEVDGVSANIGGDISIIAGESIILKVYFESDVDASDVRVKAELEGDKEDVSSRTDYFDVEAGRRYVKTLTLKVPYELKDEVSGDINLNIKVWNGDYSSETNSLVLRVQRPSYNADIFSVLTSGTVNAGELFPVDIVLKNRGYNNLDDLFVTVKIPALNLEKTAYFGDLVSVETLEDEDDTTIGRVYLRVPYDAEEGKYVLEVEVSNDDFVSSETKEITVNNDLPESVIKTESGLLFINPTNTLKMYKVVLPSGDESLVNVPAGLTKSVEIRATSNDYVVSVLTMNGKVVETFTFSSSEQTLGSPVIALTVILGIIFLVLLVVLVILVTKKPGRTEETGESYY